MTEDGDHEHLGESPAAGVGEEERAVVPVGLVDSVLSDVLLHLLDLEAHQTRVGVAVAVVLDQERNSFVFPSVGHEVAGRLGNEENADHDNDTRVSLEDQGDSPRKVRVHVLASEGDGSRGNATAEPPAVVEACAAATPVRGSNLNAVCRGSHGHDGNTDTICYMLGGLPRQRRRLELRNHVPEHEAANNELGDRRRRGDDDHTEDDDDAPRKHSLPTAKTVRKNSCEGCADHGTAGLISSISAERNR